MEQTKRGFGAWGWFLLIFGFLIFFSNGGFFADGTNVIAPAVAERLGVDRTIILNMNTVAGIVGVIIAIIAGQLNQRIGPAKVAAGCLILAGLGHIATGNAVSVPMYLIAMCCVGGGLSAGSFVGIGTLVAMWFPRKQGQAMSVVAMGSNFGTMVFVPLLTVLVGSLGIAVSSVICGVVAAVVGVIGAVMLRNTPQERGINPDNVSDRVYETEYDTSEASDNGGWTTVKLLCTKELWLAAITTGFFQICSVGVMSQLVLRNVELGFSQQTAMNVMTVLALGGVVGSWLVGIIDDAIGTKKTMILFGIWYAIALLLNFTAVDQVTPLVYVSLFMIAMGIGGSANFTTSLPASIFGRHGFDKVNSVIFPIQGAITALCFLVNGVVQNITGGQIRMAYLVFAGVALVNVVLVLLVDEHRFNRDWKAAHKG